ncbi:MAG: ABC transporter permease [Betaproteobacteria bacterium]|nr:ABC transporter permease [Betaproteobacteria bacterium]
MSLPKAMMPTTWILALRFLKERRFQSALIILGVTAGVAVVLTITELMGGLQGNLVARVLGVQAHIVVKPAEDDTRLVRDRDENVSIAARVEKRAQRLRSIDQWESALPLLERAPGVVATAPVVQGAGFAVRGAASRPVVLFGVEAERYLRVIHFDRFIVSGQFRVAANDSVVGIELAKDLGASIGDRIRITTAEGGNDTISIAGIFDVGSRDLNRRWIFASQRMAQSLLNLQGGITNIDLAVADIFESERIARSIANSAGLTVESWMATNTQTLAAFANQNMTTRVIRGFVVIIVALGIASVLVVSVVQKQKEIGILRAMGASSQSIMRIFLIQGGIVGIAGAIARSALGALIVYALSRSLRNVNGSALFAPEFAFSTFASAIGLALAVGVLAAVAPARRASLLDPVAAIRG